jgi:hypothetical protein
MSTSVFVSHTDDRSKGVEGEGGEEGWITEDYTLQ